MTDKLGISPADAEGLACYNAVHGTAEPPLSCPHSKLLADGLPHSIEIYEERLGGYFIVSVSPLFTPQGEVYGSVHYARDITKRKQAEEFLQESEKRFKTIFANNTDGLIVVDIESKKFVLGNPMIYRMLGYEEEELKRMNVMDIHPDEDLPHVLEQFEKQARGEMTIAENIPVKRKDGTVFYADINTSPLSLDGKEYILGAFRDVTDREQAKNALRDSEQKLKAIVYGSPIPQFVIDHDHTVIYWNDALAELSGIKAEELIGTKDQWRAFYAAEKPCMADLLLDGAIEKAMDMYRGKCEQSSLLANAYEALDFFPALGKDGRWLHFTAAEIKDARGKVIGVVETLEDVTERKLAEESVHMLNDELERKVEERTKQLLDAQEELVRKEKLSILGRLSGSVGHELRNPLGVMNNAVYFLKTVMPEANKTVKEYLDIIKHEIDNSQRIINDLLDFARTKPPQTKTINVRDLIDESLERCAVPENITLQTEIPNTLPALSVDPLQMGQVFQNIITNGIQAMTEGGSVRISARLVKSSTFKVQGYNEKNIELEALNSEPDPDFIEIRTADSGEGISPENMGKLFQPLFTTKAKGIGLGLVLCKNLVEANGGRIKVESRLGEGSTFSVILPVAGNEG
jgi:PAS domain S-box-containing protein